MNFKEFTSAPENIQRWYILNAIAESGMGFKQFTGSPDSFQRWFIFQALLFGGGGSSEGTSKVYYSATGFDISETIATKIASGDLLLVENVGFYLYHSGDPYSQASYSSYAPDLQSYASLNTSNLSDDADIQSWQTKLKVAETAALFLEWYNSGATVTVSEGAVYLNCFNVQFPTPPPSIPAGVTGFDFSAVTDASAWTSLPYPARSMVECKMPSCSSIASSVSAAGVTEFLSWVDAFGTWGGTLNLSGFPYPDENAGTYLAGLAARNWVVTLSEMPSPSSSGFLQAVITPFGLSTTAEWPSVEYGVTIPANLGGYADLTMFDGSLYFLSGSSVDLNQGISGMPGTVAIPTDGSSAIVGITDYDYEVYCVTDEERGVQEIWYTQRIAGIPQTPVRTPLAVTVNGMFEPSSYPYPLGYAIDSTTFITFFYDTWYMQAT